MNPFEDIDDKVQHEDGAEPYEPTAEDYMAAFQLVNDAAAREQEERERARELLLEEVFPPRAIPECWFVHQKVGDRDVVRRLVRRVMSTSAGRRDLLKYGVEQVQDMLQGKLTEKHVDYLRTAVARIEWILESMDETEYDRVQLSSLLGDAKGVISRGPALNVDRRV